MSIDDAAALSLFIAHRDCLLRIVVFQRRRGRIALQRKIWCAIFLLGGISPNNKSRRENRFCWQGFRSTKNRVTKTVFVGRNPAQQKIASRFFFLGRDSPNKKSQNTLAAKTKKNRVPRRTQTRNKL